MYSGIAIISGGDPTREERGAVDGSAGRAAKCKVAAMLACLRKVRRPLLDKAPGSSADIIFRFSRFLELFPDHTAVRENRIGLPSPARPSKKARGIFYFASSGIGGRRRSVARS